MLRRTPAAIVFGALGALTTMAGCGGGATAADAGGERPSGGMCSADVPPGQACSTLAVLGEPVPPTCSDETMPVGAGGTIVDGTYVLTAQTYYNVATCPRIGLSQTIQIAGDCMQLASGSPFDATNAVRLTIAGNGLTVMRTCSSLDPDAGFTMAGPSTLTFTATDTTFTLFTDYTVAGLPGTDSVAVYTRLQ